MAWCRTADTTGLGGHFWRALARPTLTDASEAARAAAADAGDLVHARLAHGDSAGALRVLETARGNCAAGSGTRSSARSTST